ncbi:MAG: (d)CMP kinase, partial [Clostridia bacterium]|nr:(d)CMP kinase [Clostridia bacterium]
ARVIERKNGQLAEYTQSIIEVEDSLRKTNLDLVEYVFPNADVKIYLDASIEERAKRRYNQNLEKGIETSYEDVYENIRARDENDKAKEVGALKIAEDAIVIDTTNLTIEEVKNKIIKCIKEKM